jgi:hypothetical protein
MPRDDYRKALDAAVREYERAMAERAALETRIAQLHQTIGTLTKLCGFTPTVPFGLTDACRVALRGAGRPMTAVDVRDRLHATGYDLEKYANPLAAIHTVLKRLHAAGEAASTPADESARTAYAFVGPTAPRLAPPARGASNAKRPPDARAGRPVARSRR